MKRLGISLFVAILCSWMPVVPAATADSPLPWAFDALTKGGAAGSMPAMYYDADFIQILNGLEQIGTSKICYTGRDTVLAQLDAMKASGSELLDGYSYGPVRIDSSVGAGHVGVIIYPTPNFAAGETWEDTIDQGVVVEYTNYISDDTGFYQTRTWPEWESNWAGTGLVDEDVSPGKYWNEEGPAPVEPEDPPAEGEQPEPGPHADHATPEAKARVGVGVRGSRDPNEKIGSAGAGDDHWLAAGRTLHYQVNFENVGTAPAQIVTVEDHLDTAGLDLATFAFGDISFGERVVAVPPGLATFSTLLDLRPQKDLLVRIEASLDAGAGLVRWRLESLDPATFALPDYDGFLPPNSAPPEGEGGVAYSVRPRATLASGTSIGVGLRASIVFDENAAIETADWINRIDSEAPASTVAALVTPQPGARFDVGWSGDDGAASGIEDYTVYMSVDGGPFEAWVRGRPQGTAEVWGRPGRSYAFYSVARDLVGNVEPAPALADAATTTPSLDRFLAYGASPTDAKADSLPKGCNLLLDDPLFDGAENYAVSATSRLLVPAAVGGGGVLDDATHLLAYTIKSSRQGAAAPVGRCSRESSVAGQACVANADCSGGACEGRRFPKAVRHARRTEVLVRNAFGTLYLDTLREKAVLMPTPLRVEGPPVPGLPGSAVDHFKCYGVKTMRDVTSDQAPGGSFRRGLQVLATDRFEQGRIGLCAAGSPSNAGKACTGERTCGGTDGTTTLCESAPHPLFGLAKVYDVAKPVLLCNPVVKAAIDTTEVDDTGAKRTTACSVAPAAIGSPLTSLVCYQAKTASAVVDPAVAAATGVAVGTRIAPAQAQAAAHSPFVATQLPNPGRVTTAQEFEFCVPSDTLLTGRRR